MESSKEELTRVGRYRVAAFGREGVLLDLDSGIFATLNRSGLVLGESLALGLDAHTSAVHLARAFGIPIAQAETDARAFRESLRSFPSGQVRNAVGFEESGDGELFRVHGVPVLAVDFVRGTLTAASPFPPALSPDQALRWVAPHLLWSRGVAVLHASAIEIEGGVLAFSGASGAGKTTLARMFAAAGHGLVSEDLVVLDEERRVLREGEPSIFRWAADEAGALGGNEEISWEPLVATVRSDPSRWLLSSLAFPSREDRDDFEEVQLSFPEALGLLLLNSFAERARPGLWASVFDVAEALVRSGAVGALRVPDGLAKLGAAVPGYRRTITS